MRSYFDLHCDTLSADKTELPLFGGENAVCLENMGFHAVQVCALYTAQGQSSGEARARIFEMLRRFECECARLSLSAVHCKDALDIARAARQNKVALLISLENALPLECDDRLFDTLCDAGLAMLTLTHNGGNAFAEGSYGDATRGITSQGLELLRRAEERGVCIDISHLNHRGVSELLSRYSGAVIASHANAFALCEEERNLTDDVIAEISRRGGVVGLTLHAPFVGESRDIDAFLRHIERVISVGGCDAAAIGTDFDGTDELICGVKTTADIEKIADRMAEIGYNNLLIEKILYKNAYNFFERWKRR